MSRDTGKHPPSLWRVFQQHTRSLAGRTAITMGSRELTYEELYSVADRFASSLEEAGVAEGSVVALALPNSLSFVPAALALMRLSCVLSLVSPSYRVSELSAIAQGVRPLCFLITPSLVEAVDRMLGDRGGKAVAITLVGDELVLLFPPDPRSTGNSSMAESDSMSHMPSDAALLKFTSGSTGAPKGIVWTAANVLAEGQNVVSTLELTPDDRLLAPVPVVHSYGFDLAVLPLLLAGSGMILHDHFVPRRVMEQLDGSGVTVFLGVPTMYRVLSQTRMASIPDLSHIRYLLSGTAHLDANFIRSFYDKFAVPICQHYGSSETGAATNHVPSEVLRRPDSVGLPVKNVEVEILDEAGQVLPRETEGEVVVKSSAVALGYIMGEPEGRTVIESGTFWTGDLGFIDDGGYLVVTGRKDAVINVGGLKVSPHEVIGVLESFPAVREAAVIGVKDEIGGSVVYAAVSLEGSASEQEILRYCRQHLADHKVPRRIDIMPNLPRGPSGKIRLRQADIET
jgi:long-chain acyl-CoA synthetase